MNTELNNLLANQNRVYYEYRETFYRVTSSGQEHETSWRETSVNCEDLIRMALKTSTNFVEHGGDCLSNWDMVSVSVNRFDSAGAKAIFSANLFVSDFAE